MVELEVRFRENFWKVRLGVLEGKDISSKFISYRVMGVVVRDNLSNI